MNKKPLKDRMASLPGSLIRLSGLILEMCLKDTDAPVKCYSYMEKKQS